MALAQTYEQRWQRALKVERERCLRLEETVESLARQHNRLEEVCKKGSTTDEEPVARSPDSDADLLEAEDDDNDDDSFFDAVEDASIYEPQSYQLSLLPSHQRSTSDVSLASPLLGTDVQQCGGGHGPLDGLELEKEKSAAVPVVEEAPTSQGLPNALMPPFEVQRD